MSVCLPLASLEAQQAPTPQIKNEDLITVLGLPEGYDNAAIEDLRKGFGDLVGGRVNDAIDKFKSAGKEDRTLAPPHVLVVRWLRPTAWTRRNAASNWPLSRTKTARTFI